MSIANGHTRPVPLTLNAAELCMLLATYDADPAPFIADSDLATLATDEMHHALLMARDHLLRQGLLHSQGDGTLELSPRMQVLMERLVQPKQAFELMHTQANRPPQRVQYGVDATGALAHRLDDPNAHVFEVLDHRADVIADVMGLASPQINPVIGQAQPFAIPHRIFAALGQNAATDAGATQAALQQLGIPANTAAQMLAAGLRPRQQSVFTALVLNGQRIQARSLLWFADEVSCWIVTHFDKQGAVQMQAANTATLEQAISAFVTSV